MTETQEDITLFNQISNIEVWVYANPIKGTHAKLKTNPNTLAVFKNESIGRTFEIKSTILKTMIGYYVKWDEMMQIAENECQGRYTYYTVPDN